MDASRTPSTGTRSACRSLRRGLMLAAAAVAVLAAPSVASGAEPGCVDISATKQRCTQRVGPISVAGYEVKQNYALAPHPKIDGSITQMEVNVVDPNGAAVPIQRLMLHHIVFGNLARQDETCDSILGWDNSTEFGDLAPERFYAAGEERAKMILPDGYGYKLNQGDPWFLYYMFMNHRAVRDQALIEYEFTVDTDPSLTEVKPYWLDVRNCRGDPIYNVLGNGGPGSTDVESSDFVMPESGRIVAGGGHVHGGGEKLRLSEPDCGDREIGDSIPTWGNPDHPFYNVRPVLHEPGPINMSGFNTETGIPITKGERLRLSSIYDNSQPHTRVMGINLVYLAPDSSVKKCGPLPDDMRTLRTNQPGRPGPIVPFKVPLTGLDENGQAVTIPKPPGKTKRLKSGSTIDVQDRFFSRRNVRIRRGAKLNWEFGGSEPHNVTLANGPRGIGSPNLFPRSIKTSYSKRFRKPGKYKLFCALHPVQMQERVIVKRRKHHGR
jgi:plastocyanin